MTTSDTIIRVRAHLQAQDTSYLLDLLIDMMQAMDEPLRQRFWDRLSPPAIATADLRYSSPKDFLQELADFQESVFEGDYYDEEALEYFSEDPFDRDYYHDKYGAYDYDPDMHNGLSNLGEFLTEADSYFQAKRYDVAVKAYELLISIFDGNPEDTLGVYDPLAELGEMEESFAQRYFVALKESQPTAVFYDKALAYVGRHDESYYHKHRDNFMEIVGEDGRDGVQTFLEGWADELAQKQFDPVSIGIPFRLQLLIQFYQQANQQSQIVALQKRFRKQYLAFYTPLLAQREASKNWRGVITYGEEAFTLIPEEMLERQYNIRSIDGIDPKNVRTQLAHAYEALGEAAKALAIYRPVFERKRDFESYTLIKRLATAVSNPQGEAFTADTIADLQEKLPNSIYFLCQIYLSEDQFSQAHALVKKQARYHFLNPLKLVAKAHLLIGLGKKAAPEMGRYLQDLYAKTDAADEEPTLFLRDYLPSQSATSRETAVSRAETLYRNLMQLHIDNGRKTYATAAYYCALLGEIADYDSRKAEFKQFYQALLSRYPRHRALRRELAAKVSEEYTI
ncbi:MAG: hypothetical protein GY805_24965 [Chloroflexi bacterium]|nr:hypothetical protein [Chloroflexota bacterium]